MILHHLSVFLYIFVYIPNHFSTQYCCPVEFRCSGFLPTFPAILMFSWGMKKLPTQNMLGWEALLHNMYRTLFSIVAIRCNKRTIWNGSSVLICRILLQMLRQSQSLLSTHQAVIHLLFSQFLSPMFLWRRKIWLLHSDHSVRYYLFRYCWCCYYLCCHLLPCYHPSCFI